MSKTRMKPKTIEKSIAEEIAELRAMAVPELVNRYEAVFGKPPRVKHREWLWRRIAWKLQEQRFGGLSTVALRRLDELIAELDLPLHGDRTLRGRISPAGKPGDPKIGTTLTRQWRTIEVRATRVEGGWEYDGVVHRSLSAVVRAATGSHASGPAWFGLRRKEAK